MSTVLLTAGGPLLGLSVARPARAQAQQRVGQRAGRDSQSQFLPEAGISA